MSDSLPKQPSWMHRQPVPITSEELLANWDSSFDQVLAGETFMIPVDGQPVLYLISGEQYDYYLAQGRHSSQAGAKEGEKPAS